MPKFPVPGPVEHGAIRPPNVASPGARSANGSVPLAGAASSVRPPNQAQAGRDFCGGSADLAGQPSPVAPVNHRFDVNAAKMPQPPAAIEPGKGAVPVMPWETNGKPAPVVPTADMPPRVRGR